MPRIHVPSRDSSIAFEWLPVLHARGRPPGRDMHRARPVRRPRVRRSLAMRSGPRSGRGAPKRRASPEPKGLPGRPIAWRCRSPLRGSSFDSARPAPEAPPRGPHRRRVDARSGHTSTRARQSPVQICPLFLSSRDITTQAKGQGSTLWGRESLSRQVRQQSRSHISPSTRATCSSAAATSCRPGSAGGRGSTTCTSRTSASPCCARSSAAAAA